MCRGIMQSKSSPGADEDAEDEPASLAVLSDLEKDWCYEWLLMVTANINTKQA